MVTPDSLENSLHVPSSLTTSASTLSSKATSTMSIVAATIKSKNQVNGCFNYCKCMLKLKHILQVIGLNDTSLLANKTIDSFLTTLNEKNIRLLLDLAKLAFVYRLGPTAESILINTFICKSHYLFNDK